MSFVRTLAGDIDPETLGVTYAHDHLFCVPPFIWHILRRSQYSVQSRIAIKTISSGISKSAAFPACTVRKHPEVGY